MVTNLNNIDVILTLCLDLNICPKKIPEHSWINLIWKKYLELWGICKRGFNIFQFRLCLFSDVNLFLPTLFKLLTFPFIYMHAVSLACVSKLCSYLILVEARRKHKIPENWRFRQLASSTLLLGTQMHPLENIRFSSELIYLPLSHSFSPLSILLSILLSSFLSNTQGIVLPSS